MAKWNCRVQRKRLFGYNNGSILRATCAISNTHISGNILDLVLCNREGMINDVRAEGRIGKSDHDLVSFMVVVEKKKENSNK